MESKRNKDNEENFSTDIFEAGLKVTAERLGISIEQAVALARKQAEQLRQEGTPDAVKSANDMLTYLSLAHKKTKKGGK